MQNPYSSPGVETTRIPGQKATPAVVTWFRVYAVFMALMYLMVILGGFAFLVLGNTLADEETPAELILIYGIVFVVMGIPLLIMYIAGIFMPAKRWAWIYGIVLIGFGMTSCLLPAGLCAAFNLLDQAPGSDLFWSRGQLQCKNAMRVGVLV